MPQPQLIIGLFTEGNTDVQFLTSVVKRTFDDIIIKECRVGLEIWDIQNIKINRSSFIEDVMSASREGWNTGIMILCIHTDADNSSDANVYQTKINPALDVIENCSENICKNIVPVIPVQMTESWMLADKNLLKKLIGTNKSDNDLEISRPPEAFADPKEAIKAAIRIANKEKTKRTRKELEITDIYQQIGQSLSIDALEEIPSFVKFQNNIRTVLKTMNYLQ
jgi:hypothetical protein